MLYHNYVKVHYMSKPRMAFKLTYFRITYTNAQNMHKITKTHALFWLSNYCLSWNNCSQSKSCCNGTQVMIERTLDFVYLHAFVVRARISPMPYCPFRRTIQVKITTRTFGWDRIRKLNALIKKMSGNRNIPGNDIINCDWALCVS